LTAVRALAKGAIGLAVALSLAGVASARAETPRLGHVRSWAYQLQKADPAEIRRSRYDLVVIDYGFNQGSDGGLPREVLNQMRRKPDGTRRVILAYFSIGEAESYRYYWRETWLKERPEWLGTENPNWPGNYPVRYWHPEWQSILFGNPGAYLDRILNAGFDGVYLDGVDQFEHWKQRRPSAIPDMVDLVGRFQSSNHIQPSTGRDTLPGTRNPQLTSFMESLV
jgi:cysteinyl-tRNA synthetase, unknown class